MKFLTPQLMQMFGSRASKRNVRVLALYLAVFVGIVLVYAVIFHLLMLREERQHSWLTGVYWTLTVMSTLGFGDVTFRTDIGRLFSMVVLLTGMAYLLVMMPFTFIEFFYAPWMKAQLAARAPRSLPTTAKDHVIVTHLDPVTTTLIQKLNQYHHPYVLLEPELNKALELHDLDYQVVVGHPDTPETYEQIRVDQAAMVVATGREEINTNIAFTVREIAPKTPVVSTANSDAAEEILRLAGSSQVLRLDKLMGQSLARRTIGGDARAHTIGHFDNLMIAEATVAGTPIQGKTLGESRLREMVGVTVVGVWERGKFESPRPDTMIGPNTVLVLAGSADQIQDYNELFCIYHLSSAPILVVGGGKVGMATAEALKGRRLSYRIIEQDPRNVVSGEPVVVGNAAAIETLQEAGISEAPTVIITTREDDTNIYLAILCRRLRPDLQIISRVTHERNVSTMHRAGADFVMSYASMGANAIFNLLRRSEVLMLAEGLNVFRIKTPAKLIHKAILESDVRRQTGCSIVAVGDREKLEINPAPDTVLLPGQEIVLIGSMEGESRFLEIFDEG